MVAFGPEVVPSLVGPGQLDGCVQALRTSTRRSEAGSDRPVVSRRLTPSGSRLGSDPWSRRGDETWPTCLGGRLFLSL
jgi:hypothetical protein